MEHRSAARKALEVAALSALPTAVGVWVLAYRCDNKTVMGDGPVPFAPVMVTGLLLFVLPFTLAVYVASARHRGLLAVAAVLSVSAAVLLATRRPGNLVILWFPYVLVPNLWLLFVARFVAGRLATSGHASLPRSASPTKYATSTERAAQDDSTVGVSERAGSAHRRLHPYLPESATRIELIA